MGLIGRLAGPVTTAAVARPHVLLVEVPGGRTLRRAVEDALDDRGWRRAASPGTADVLVLAGEVTGSLVPYVDRVAAQLPGPHARVDLTRSSQVAVGLDHAVAQLADIADQRRVATDRSDPRWVHREDGEPAEPGHMAPGGIPLAEGGPDRDGLEMDRLRVPLGPVLDHWPAGLVLATELHGDVVADARVTWLGHETPPASGIEHTARVLDACADVLTLVGDERRARRARGLRRRVLSDEAGTRTQARVDLDRLAARFESRLMRHSLGEPAHELAGQLRALLDAHPADTEPDLLDDAALRAHLVGRDLGEVRLLVAALSARLALDLPVTAPGPQR